MSVLTVEDFQGNIKESTSKSFKVGNNYFAAEAIKVGTRSDGSNKYNYNLIRYDGPDLTGETKIGFLNPNTNKLDFFPTVQNIVNTHNLRPIKGLIDKNFKNSIKTLDITDKDKVDNTSKEDGTGDGSINSAPISQPNPESRKQNYGNYAYPVTIRRGNQDRLKISVLSRNLRLEKNNKRLTGADRRTSDIKGSVVLPIPGNLSDKNAVNFKNGTLNPLEVAIGSLSLAALLNPSSLGEEGGRILNQARSDINNVRSGVANLFTGRVLNRSGNELLARTQGAIVNPNLELLFDGPTLRPFTFNYRLSPRDRGESIVVKKIIRMFKQSSAVRLSASNFFLRSPNTYRLQFFEGSSTLGKEHAFLPRIKECALIAFSVNYTPDGTFMSYENSSMVSYDVTFAFQEIDPITSEDYKAIDGNRDEIIGF